MATVSKPEPTSLAVENLIHAAEACRNIVANAGNRFLLQWLDAAIAEAKGQQR